MSDHLYTPTDHQVPIRLGDLSSPPQVLINAGAIGAIRNDLTEQADMWIVEIGEEWPRTVLNDLDSVQRLAFKLGMALDCMRAIVELAPTPDDEDVAS